MKPKKSTKSHVVTVYNCSKQLISLQVRAPGSDFYTNEQQVRIPAGRSAQLPKAYLRSDQLGNLKARGMIKIVYDSELQAERDAAFNS